MVNEMITETKFQMLKEEYKKIFKQLPKDQRWVALLDFWKETRGWKYKFVYGNEVLNKPKMAYDPEKGGIGYEMPDKVIVFKEHKQGYWVEDKKVTEIDFRSWADPTPEESLKLLDFFDRL